MSHSLDPYGRPLRVATPPSRWLAGLSLLNLCAVLVTAGLLMYWSEDWWLTTILVFVPKAPLLVPGGLLVLASLATRPAWLLPNLLSLAIVMGPIMGFVAPVSRWMQGASAEPASGLRIVSCNIQGFRPDFPRVIEELATHRPDLVAFQEVRGEDHPLLGQFFADWHVVREDGYWIGSKFPIRKVSTLTAPSFDRVSGLLAEVDLPTGPVLIADIHLMTIRRSLSEVTPRGILLGKAAEVVEPHQFTREEEMMEVRARIEDLRAGKPLVVLGDFNTPVSSSLFRRWWGDLQSAFDTAGFGFGYTSPCRKNQQHWFDDTPWVRIDHVLCSAEWQIVRCEIGTSDGSDHRLIAATVAPLGQPVRKSSSALTSRTGDSGDASRPE